MGSTSPKDSASESQFLDPASLFRLCNQNSELKATDGIDSLKTNRKRSKLAKETLFLFQQSKVAERTLRISRPFTKNSTKSKENSHEDSVTKSNVKSCLQNYAVLLDDALFKTVGSQTVEEVQRIFLMKFIKVKLFTQKT